MDGFLFLTVDEFVYVSLVYGLVYVIMMSIILFHRFIIGTVNI